MIEVSFICYTVTAVAAAAADAFGWNLFENTLLFVAAHGVAAKAIKFAAYTAHTHNAYSTYFGVSATSRKTFSLRCYTAIVKRFSCVKGGIRVKISLEHCWRVQSMFNLLVFLICEMIVSLLNFHFRWKTASVWLQAKYKWKKRSVNTRKKWPKSMFSDALKKLSPHWSLYTRKNCAQAFSSCFYYYNFRNAFDRSSNTGKRFNF